MGQIASTYDIMLNGTDVDPQGVVAGIPGILPAGVELKSAEVKDFVFGMKKVVAFFVIDDSIDGVGGQLEDGLRSIDGVGEIECSDSTTL